MNFLIDTNILIYALQRRSGPVFHDFLFQLTARGLSFISVISRFEVLAGTTEAFKKSNKTFMDSFPCLDMTREISDRAAGLFRDYKKRGLTVDNEDRNQVLTPVIMLARGFRSWSVGGVLWRR